MEMPRKLTPKDAFLSGMATLFNLFPDIRLSEDTEDQDAENIHSYFVSVGNDIRSGMAVCQRELELGKEEPSSAE